MKTDRVACQLKSSQASREEGDLASAKDWKKKGLALQSIANVTWGGIVVGLVKPVTSGRRPYVTILVAVGACKMKYNNFVQHCGWHVNRREMITNMRRSVPWRGYCVAYVQLAKMRSRHLLAARE